jgi:hypothetical protein
LQPDWLPFSALHLFEAAALKSKALKALRHMQHTTPPSSGTRKKNTLEHAHAALFPGNAPNSSLTVLLGAFVCLYQSLLYLTPSETSFLPFARETSGEPVFYATIGL